MRAVAWSVGNRLLVRDLEGWPAPVATAPLTFAHGGGGYAVLFRFGAVAAIGLPEEVAKGLVSQVQRLATEPREPVVTEEIEILVAEGGEEGVDARGCLTLHSVSVGRAQVTASVLAKSVVLGDYEGHVEAIFERLEPFAMELQQGRLSRGGQALMRELGAVLLTQSRMMGRAEIAEKPDIAWDDPALDRLYQRLALEYELRDREHALVRKLDLISHAASTYLDLLSDRRTLRVEWYIVILIVVEIILILYELFGIH